MTLTLPARAARAGEIVAPPEDGGREIEISFSSEAPYLRYDWEEDRHYWEVLGHRDGEVDLGRLNGGVAPLLKDHMAVLDAQIGVVARAWLDGTKGRATVRFSESAAAEDVLARVRAGDVTCVSVGYGIVQARQDGTADGHPVVRVTEWEPREISFVAVPADPTVGYGRSVARGEEQITVIEEQDMPEANEPGAAGTPAAEAATPAVAEPTHTAARATPSVEGALSAERTRTDAIERLGERFEVPMEKVRRAKRDGTSIDVFREQVLDQMDATSGHGGPAANARIGMSDQEIRSFSIMNVVRYLERPSEKNAEKAAFEIEASEAAARAMGREPEGVFVPADVLLDKSFARAQATSPDSAGGYLVAQELASGSFIDLLRNRLALSGLGVRMMSGLVGNVDIPKQVGGTTAYWLGEGEDGTESEIELDVVQLSPKTVGIATPITRRQIKQSTPDIEALVRTDMIEQMARAIDYAALVGAGSAKAPEGLRAKLVAAGRMSDWAGDLPTFEEVVDLESSIHEAAADNALAYIYNRGTGGHFKKTLEFPGVGGDKIERGGEVNGYSGVRSGQVAAGEVFFGAWSDMMIGMWGGLDLRADTATLAKSDGLVLRSFQDIDVDIRHIESFAAGKPSAV